MQTKTLVGKYTVKVATTVGQITTTEFRPISDFTREARLAIYAAAKARR
jgi:hypothetical protein